MSNVKYILCIYIYIYNIVTSNVNFINGESQIYIKFVGSNNKLCYFSVTLLFIVKQLA